uniref:KH domain-containing protein n=1 Tax=Macrostomum lignano TaxID=282301 RepID=A0A1I8IVD1_9PLAT
TVAMRSFARHLPSNHSGPRATTLYPGESSNLRQQQQQAPVSKTSTSTHDLVDGGGTSSPPVMTRPRPVTMSGLRNAAIIQSPTDKSSVDSTKIFNTIGNLQRQPPKRPPPPRPPPPKPSSIAAARGSTPPLEAAEDVEQQDDSSSVDDDGDDVSTDSSHELRVSLHLVPTSTAPKLPSAASFDVEDNYSVKGRLASMAFKRSNSLATNRLMLTNGPPPLPPLSSLPDEAPSSPAPAALPPEVQQAHKCAVDRGEDTYIDPATGYRVFTELAHKNVDIAVDTCVDIDDHSHLIGKKGSFHKKLQVASKTLINFPEVVNKGRKLKGNSEDAFIQSDSSSSSADTPGMSRSDEVVITPAELDLKREPCPPEAEDRLAEVLTASVQNIRRNQLVIIRMVFPSLQSISDAIANELSRIASIACYESISISVEKEAPATFVLRGIIESGSKVVFVANLIQESLVRKFNQPMSKLYTADRIPINHWNQVVQTVNGAIPKSFQLSSIESSTPAAAVHAFFKDIGVTIELKDDSVVEISSQDPMKVLKTKILLTNSLPISMLIASNTVSENLTDSNAIQILEDVYKVRIKCNIGDAFGSSNAAFSDSAYFKRFFVGQKISLETHESNIAALFDVKWLLSQKNMPQLFSSWLTLARARARLNSGSRRIPQQQRKQLRIRPAALLLRPTKPVLPSSDLLRNLQIFESESHRLRAQPVLHSNSNSSQPNPCRRRPQEAPLSARKLAPDTAAWRHGGEVDDEEDLMMEIRLRHLRLQIVTQYMAL